MKYYAAIFSSFVFPSICILLQLQQMDQHHLFILSKMGQKYTGKKIFLYKVPFDLSNLTNRLV